MASISSERGVVVADWRIPVRVAISPLTRYMYQ